MKVMMSHHVHGFLLYLAQAVLFRYIFGGHLLIQEYVCTNQECVLTRSVY